MYVALGLTSILFALSMAHLVGNGRHVVFFFFGLALAYFDSRAFQDESTSLALQLTLSVVNVIVASISTRLWWVDRRRALQR